MDRDTYVIRNDNTAMKIAAACDRHQTTTCIIDILIIIIIYIYIYGVSCML